MAEGSAEHPVLEPEGESSGSVHRTPSAAGGSLEHPQSRPELGAEEAAEKFSGLRRQHDLCW